MAANAAPADGAADGVAARVGRSRSAASVRATMPIRALDAVAAFFSKNEPSSPVPLLVERAKRLVAKDFLDVLADIAPEGFEQAKSRGHKGRVTAQ